MGLTIVTKFASEKVINKHQRKHLTI